MRKQKHTNGSNHAPNGNEYLSTQFDFYTGAPTERPLYQDHPNVDSRREARTERHQSETEFHKENADPRDKMALLAMLKLVIMILILVIALFMLWHGVAIYEDKIVADNQAFAENMPLMNSMDPSSDISMNGLGANDILVEQLKAWEDTERLMRSVDGLLHHNNYDQAIARCQQALQLDPLHMGAMDRLGHLYTKLGRHGEAINIYIRLLLIDPSNKGYQKELVKSLAQHGDAVVVVATARWYLDQNSYDEEIQRYMADAQYILGHFNEAATAYERVLKDSPKDALALENKAMSYMHLEMFDKALDAWKQLSEINYRDPDCYKQIAICNAQLENGRETVQTLGVAAHLFGQDIVLVWMQDPMLDPVRQDRHFQVFSERIGSKEFQKWLDTVANVLEEEQEEKGIDPLLQTEEQGAIGENMLQLDK